MVFQRFIIILNRQQLHDTKNRNQPCRIGKTLLCLSAHCPNRELLDQFSVSQPDCSRNPQLAAADTRCLSMSNPCIVYRCLSFLSGNEGRTLTAGSDWPPVYNTAAAPMTPRFIDCVWPFRGANDELLAGHRSDTMANECAEAFSSAVRSCARVGIAFFFGWTAKKDFIQLTTRSYQPANNTAAVPHLPACFLSHSHRLLPIYKRPAPSLNLKTPSGSIKNPTGR